MLKTLASQRAEEGHFPAAVLPQPAGGKVGVSIILDMGQHDGALVPHGGLGRGIEIAHNQVRHDAERFGVAVACVTGNDERARFQIRGHGSADRHRRENDGPDGHGLLQRRHRSHSFRWLASSYMAR